MYIKKLTKNLALGGLVVLMATPTYAAPKDELDKVSTAVRNYKETLTIKSEGLTVTGIKAHIDSLGLYNIAGFKSSANKGNYNIIFEYIETPTELEGVKRLSSMIATEVIGLSIEEKVYHITQRISEIMTYDHNHGGSKLSISPTAMTSGGLGVCQSYARTAQMIFDQAGVSNTLITGSLPSGPHMWNVVKATNGEWYSVDITGADVDEYSKIDFSKIFMTKSQLKEYEYKISKVDKPLSDKPVQKFDGLGLYSKLNKKFYAYMLENSNTVYSYSLESNKLDVEGYGENYWVVGGELFILDNGNIINNTNNKTCYEGLNPTDIITNKGAELKVNDKTIYNSSDLPKGKVFVIDGDFKVSFINTKQFPFFHAEETPNRTNIYYGGRFLVQYLKRG